MNGHAITLAEMLLPQTLILLEPEMSRDSHVFIITYFISISKTNAPEQPIDMKMKKDNNAKV